MRTEKEIVKEINHLQTIIARKGVLHILYCLSYKQGTTGWRYSQLQKATGLSYGSLFTTLKKLTEQGLVEKKSPEGVAIEIYYLTTNGLSMWDKFAHLEEKVLR